LSKKNERKRANIEGQIKIGTVAVGLKLGVPYRSGELQRSFKTTQTPDGQIEIKTDIYYMPFTNEPWTSPKWKGAVNPNERWFEETAEFIAKAIARHTGGTYVRIK